MVFICVIQGMAACNSGGGGDGDGPPPTVIIETPQAVIKGELESLSATVVDAAPGVTWTLEGGSEYGMITPDGIYTAPDVVPDGPVIVRATSIADSRGTATSTIRVIVGGQLDPTLYDNTQVPNVGGVGSTFSAGQRSIAVSGPLVYFVWSQSQAGVDRTYLNVSRDRGQTFDPMPISVSQPATGPHRFPVVAVDGFGRAVVAWVGQDGTVWKVHARSVSVGASGSLVLGNVRDIATMGAVNDPRVALDVDRQGNAYLAWTSEGTSDTDILMVRWESATGGTFNLSSVVPASANSASDQIRPAIAVNDSGGVLVAWCDPRDDALGSNDVWWRRARFSNGAIEFDFPEARANSVVEEHQVHASVALNELGLAGVVWSDVRTGQRRHVYFVQSGDTNLGLPSELREVLVVDAEGINADQNFPSLAFDLDGGITVAFADNRKCIEENDPQACDVDSDNTTGPTDIYVARSVDGGVSFHASEKVNDDDQAQHGGPSVTVDEVGRAFLLWTDDRVGSNPSLPYMARVE